MLPSRACVGKQNEQLKLKYLLDKAETNSQNYHACGIKSTIIHQSIKKVLSWTKFQSFAAPPFCCDSTQVRNQSTFESHSTFETDAFRTPYTACVAFGSMICRISRLGSHVIDQSI